MNSKEVNALEKAQSLKIIIDKVRKTNNDGCDEIKFFNDNTVIRHLIEFGYDVTILPDEEKMIVSWKNFKEGRKGSLDAKI